MLINYMNINRLRAGLIVFLLFFIQISLSAETQIISSKDRLLLNSLMVLESNMDEGKYLSGNLDQQGFVPYAGGYMPKTKPANDRMITLRTSFKADPSLKNTSLSVIIGPGSYAYQVYLNNHLVYKVGRFVDGYNSTIYNTFNILLSKDLVKYDGSDNDLAVQLYPKEEIEPFSPLYLTSFSAGAAEAFWRTFIGVNIIQASFVFALVIAMFFFFLFVTRKGKDKVYLYFSFVCVAFCLGYFNMTFYNDAIDVLLIEKISRIGLPMTGTMLSIFYMEYTGIMKKSILVKLLLLVPLACISIIVVFQPTKDSIANLFKIVTNFYLTPVLIYTVVILILGIIRNKNKSSWILFFGYLVSVAGSLHDISYLSATKIPYTWLVPHSYLILVISVFFLLALEQSAVYLRSLERETELNKKNSALKLMMDNIIKVSESLVESSGKLEENINSTVNVVGNYSDSNRKIMDEFLAQFSGIEGEINQIAHRIDVSGEKMPRAITNQTAVVEEVNHTLSEMNSHIESTMKSAGESDAVARNLSEIAEKSTRTILKSRESIARVSEYSHFIRDVLNAIQDITEKTNILSMNASIEATKAGVYGKGFSVVAGEIRKLAKQSRDSLVTSFEKIKEMTVVIQDSNDLSSQVSESLSRIIEESKQSADSIGEIYRLIEEQEGQSAEILQSVKSLFEETVTIRDLSIEEQKYNEGLKQKLLEMKKTFGGIAVLLKEQDEKKSVLYNSLNAIQDVMVQNQKNIEILNGSIATEKTL